MAKLSKSAHRLYLTITKSIAFWPTIISFFFFLLAIYVWYFEGTRLSSYLESQIPIFKNLKEDIENARLLLNIIATGTITLTVFSFSMVMIVLSQTSSNLSPRVIPRLISDKSNQIVLGVYVGTIIYCLVLILSFKPGKANATIPVIGILLGLLLSIMCLALFVYFIHAISQSIQVDSILKRIYARALQEFKNQEDLSTKYPTTRALPENQNWYIFNSVESGYLRRIVQEKLLKFAQSHHLVMEVLVPLGTFLVIGKPFLRINQDPAQVRQLKGNIRDCFIFSLDEMQTPDYEYNFRQICEIAMKALSPGINDPGTALNALNFMTLLFLEKIKTNDIIYWCDSESQIRVISKRTSLDDLLFKYLAPIRTYGKGDVMVILKLLDCLNTLIRLNKEDQYYQILLNHVCATREDADRAIRNSEDRKRINESLNRIKDNLQSNKFKADLEDLPLLVPRKDEVTLFEKKEI